MTSATLEEKRLKQLKQQLFGKEQPITVKSAKAAHSQLNHINFAPTSIQTALVNPSSLRTDLIKILVFSTVAITIQFLLFFAHRLGLVRFF